MFSGQIEPDKWPLVLARPRGQAQAVPRVRHFMIKKVKFYFKIQKKLVPFYNKKQEGGASKEGTMASVRPPTFFLFLLSLLPFGTHQLSTKLLSRRSFFSSSVFFVPASIAAAVPESPLRLGVVNGLLADCDSRTCISSQDDATNGGRCFAEPWTYDGSLKEAFAELKAAVVDFRAGGLSKDTTVEVISEMQDEGGRYSYLRVAYFNQKTGAIDDCEWYFPGNDVTVQFRIGRRAGTGAPDLTRELERRMENLRKSLGFEKIPVLRNRRRALPFGESPLDSFGPSTRDYDYPDDADAVDAVELDAKNPLKMKGLRLEADPLAAPFVPSTKAMRQLKNERPQLDDMLLPF
jgi:uncharacterized protein (DUF1499 family)